MKQKKMNKVACIELSVEYLRAAMELIQHKLDLIIKYIILNSNS